MGTASPEEEALALSITASYSDAREDQIVEVTISGREMRKLSQGKKCNKGLFSGMLIQ